MRAFSQQPRALQRATSATSNLARPHFGPGRDLNAGPLLQARTGNQVVQQVPDMAADVIEGGLSSTSRARFGHDFSQTPVSPPAAGAIQTKLTVSKVGDGCEQEADRVADRVMRTPEHLQPISQASDTGQTASSPVVDEVLRSPGKPLDSATRAFMEPRFGHDFSRVRVHTDARAEKSAELLKARAYTVKDNVIFGAGQFVPMTDGGRRLIAHELAHVVQQASGASAQIQRMPSEGTQDDMAQGQGEQAPSGQGTTQGIQDSPQADDPNPCAGWEQDPQSFSIALAKFFYGTDFPNPKGQNPSVVSVTGAWDPKVAFWVAFDNGDTVGISMKHVPTKHMAVACAKVGNLCDINNRCEYTYSCSASGSIAFSKLRCRNGGNP